MAVEKITISLPVELVAAIDAFSAEAKASRSSVVREAAALYLSEHEAQREAQRRRAAADDVLRLLGELHESDVFDKRAVGDILREARGPLDEESR
jgi:metal-responsive CopG/Arc/MetJ family transcriptional regulator